MKKFLGKLFLKTLGWKLDYNVPKEVHEQCVLIAAPHTSNWDYPIAIAAMSAMGVKIRYTIKKEWMRPPFGFLFKGFGGIGIDRSPKNKNEKKRSMVSAIADLFKEHPKLCVMVPAEGTRMLQPKWKTGFYYIALEAGVPIVLGFLDYEKKQAGIGKVIYPTGDVQKDMHEIMQFFKDVKGKFPNQFVLDERFYPKPNPEEKNSGEKKLETVTK